MITYDPPSIIKDGVVYSVLSSKCGYPVSELFTPALIDDNGRLPQLFYKRFRQELERKFPPTSQDVEFEKRTGFPRREQTPGGEFSPRSGTINDWDRDGICWKRRVEGAHANCWTDSRVGAVYMWRDHKHSYGYDCSQSPDFRDKLATETETLKPVVYTVVGGRRVSLSIDRDIAAPHGVVWGYTTGQVYWRLDIEGRAPVAVKQVWTHLQELLREQITGLVTAEE